MPANWPHLVVEAGLVNTSPVEGSLTFLLDDVSHGVLNTNVLGGGVTWSELTTWLRSGHISRSVTRQTGPLYSYQLGVASAVLKNADGRFDPENLSGPYVSAGQTQLNPMVPFRYRAVWEGTEYRLYHGFTDSWDDDGVNYAGHYAETTVAASDAQKILGGIQVRQDGPSAGLGESTGARINRILDAAPWYTDAPMRVVGAGSSTVQAFGGQSDGTSDSAWNLMAQAADSEIGELYVNGNGAVVFRGRLQLLTDLRSRVPQLVLGDSPGAVHPQATATSQANSFEGGADGTAVTAANSGGGSGDAFASVSASGGGSVTYRLAAAQHGALGMACVTTGSASTAYAQYGAASPPQLWTRFYLEVPAYPAATDNVVRFASAANGLLCKLMLTTGGVLQLANAASAVVASFSTTLPAGQPARVEMTATFPGVAGAAAAEVRLYLSDPESAVPDETETVSAQNFGSAAVDHAQFGQSASVASNFTVYVDDIDLNSTGWAGPARSGSDEKAYYQAPRARDDTTLTNDVHATRTGGTLQEVQDAASQAKYLFPRTYERSDLILQNDSDVLNWAQWVLYVAKDGEDRFDTITLKPLRDPAGLWPQVLGREIGDRIRIWRRPPGMAAFFKDAFIRGIEHTFSISPLEWTTVWTLQDASKYAAFLTLDNPVTGQLDANALAY